ncbi:SecY protein transport family protein [Hibiscus syriacus]|uniref:SecY protein transport family protein n=1 Tax=Hibiscus syriacus TaxID=106335 RepID=A0A6A2YIU8_HIBSY|nr:SecY protein transport family protein [Hibiscus syriacus]
MAAAGVRGNELGFEEAMPWLPSHVLDEAIWETNKTKNDVKYNYHHHRHRSKLPVEPFSPVGSRRHQKPRYWGGYASGGPGMQALFLDSGERSSGTGVFLPQRAGTNFHSNRKPACSPVLLPCRVVEALNLNVQELGLQISPRRGLTTCIPFFISQKNSKLKDGNDHHHQYHHHHHHHATEDSSPDIFLPREWTY